MEEEDSDVQQLLSFRNFQMAPEPECFTVLGLCGKVFVTMGLQGWLLWEATRNFPLVY